MQAISVSAIPVLAGYEFRVIAPGVGRFYSPVGIDENLIDPTDLIDVQWNGNAVIFKCDNELAMALRSICKPSNLAYGSTNSRKNLTVSKKGKPLHGAALIKRRDKLNATTKPTLQQMFDKVDEIMDSPLYA